MSSICTSYPFFIIVLESWLARIGWEVDEEQIVRGKEMPVPRVVVMKDAGVTELMTDMRV
jgi:hypothetical protein